MPPAARHIPSTRIEGDKPKRQRFKRYPIGFFHMDIAEVQTAEGKLYLFVPARPDGVLPLAMAPQGSVLLVSDRAGPR